MLIYVQTVMLFLGINRNRPKLTKPSPLFITGYVEQTGHTPSMDDFWIFNKTNLLSQSTHT